MSKYLNDLIRNIGNSEKSTYKWEVMLVGENEWAILKESTKQPPFAIFHGYKNGITKLQ